MHCVFCGMDFHVCCTNSVQFLVWGTTLEVIKNCSATGSVISQMYQIAVIATLCVGPVYLRRRQLGSQRIPGLLLAHMQYDCTSSHRSVNI